MMAASTSRPMNACDKCGIAHDLSRCKGHSTTQNGAQCRKRPMAGQPVCGTHGGRAPQNKASGATRTTDKKLRETLGRLTVVPVENPLLELQALAGEAKAWKELCAGLVSELKSLRYSTDGGEQIRGEIQLFERAMDRCERILTSVARLNIDERLVRIAEWQKAMVLDALTAGLAKVGVDGSRALEARTEAARHLRAVS